MGDVNWLSTFSTIKDAVLSESGDRIIEVGDLVVKVCERGSCSNDCVK